MSESLSSNTESNQNSPEKKKTPLAAITAVTGVVLLAISTTFFLEKKPSKTQKPQDLPQLPRKENNSNPKKLDPDNLLATDISSQFFHDKKVVRKVSIKEIGGQGREFSITKGRDKDLNPQPIGLPSVPHMGGPISVEFNYDVMTVERNEKQVISKIFLRVHITRSSGRLIRVTAEGPAGYYRLPISGGMEEQNHFGVVNDFIKDILTGKITQPTK